MLSLVAPEPPQLLSDARIAIERDAPNASGFIVADVKCAVRTDSQTRRAVDRSTRILMRSGEAIGEDHVAAGRLSVGKRLEHDIVAALRTGRAVPRAMKGDERAAVDKPSGNCEAL